MGLESNIVYNMDCLEGMKLIANASVDMVLCDLPYGTTKCKWDVLIPFDLLWEQYLRISKDRAAIVLFGSEPFSSQLRLSALKHYKYDWTWNKVTARGHLVAKKRPMQQTECISVFSKTSHNYFPVMTPRLSLSIKKSSEYVRTEIMGGKKTLLGEKKVYDKWYPKTLLEFSNASSSKRIHPTQKPVPLFEYLIQTYTKPGELVLDNCIGSGTTAIACLNTGRSYIGFENDPIYYEAAAKLIATHSESLLGQTS